MATRGIVGTIYCLFCIGFCNRFVFDYGFVTPFLYRLRNCNHIFIYKYIYRYISRVNHPQTKTINELEETEYNNYKL